MTGYITQYPLFALYQTNKIQILFSFHSNIFTILEKFAQENKNTFFLFRAERGKADFCCACAEIVRRYWKFAKITTHLRSQILAMGMFQNVKNLQRMSGKAVPAGVL
jgi:hypothetical protein